MPTRWLGIAFHVIAAFAFGQLLCAAEEGEPLVVAELLDDSGRLLLVPLPILGAVLTIPNLGRC